MGLLDFLGSGGGLSHLLSGIGNKGGLLQKMGMGQYGSEAGGQPPGMAGQLGQGQGFTGFLHGLGDKLANPDEAKGPPPLPPMPNMMAGGGGGDGQQPGLAELIAAYMKSNQRQ